MIFREKLRINHLMQLKKIKGVIGLLGLLLVFMLLPSACVDEHSIDSIEKIDNGSKDITITLQMPAASRPGSPTTRAISAIDENKIATIDVLAFKRKESNGFLPIKRKAPTLVMLPEVVRARTKSNLM